MKRRYCSSARRSAPDRGRKWTSPSTRSRARRCAPRICRVLSQPLLWPRTERSSTRRTSTWTRSRWGRVPQKNVVDLDAQAEENIINHAKAKGVNPETITAMILDRPRHADLIGAVRKAGAAVSLITDGDVAGVIHTADPDKTGIDI